MFQISSWLQIVISQNLPASCQALQKSLTKTCFGFLNKYSNMQLAMDQKNYWLCRTLLILTDDSMIGIFVNILVQFVASSGSKVTGHTVCRTLHNLLPAVYFAFHKYSSFAQRYRTCLCRTWQNWLTSVCFFFYDFICSFQLLVGQRLPDICFEFIDILLQIVDSDETRITEHMQNPNEFAGDNVLCFFINILLQFLVSDGSMIAGLIQQKNCRLTGDGIFCSLIFQYYNSQWTVSDIR